MKKEIYHSLPKAREFTERAVSRAKKGGKVIIIGVGNSCGISDSKKAVEEVKTVVEELDKKYKLEEKKNKGGGWF